MLNTKDFRRYVIRPTIEDLGLWSESAEVLLLGTALVESGLRCLRQIGGGPALGLYQIEPKTHDDIWKTYLNMSKSRKALAAKVTWLTARSPLHDQLIWNLAYATAIARIVYWRRPESLPEANDIAGLAKYWKIHYNTVLGAGREVDFISKLTTHL